MQSSTYEVQDSEMKYVGVGPRFLALFIDVIIPIAAVFILSAISTDIDSILRIIENKDIVFFITSIIHIMYSIAVLMLLLTILGGYPIIMEVTLGATIGKMVLGLRVVREDGMPISWKESIIRHLLRIVDLPFYGLVGAIAIWTSPNRQRLGDRVAKTVVIRRR